MKAQEPRRFGPFIVVREIGHGGMGEVLLARTPWPEVPLAAVKRLRPDVARHATFAERFRHEAELAVRLSHPHLVGTIGVGTVENQPYVASELVLGRDIGRIADRLYDRGLGGPVSVGIRIAIDGLMGLAYVHRATDGDGTPLELIHRDVTPGNILVGYDGCARLADFGLAKSLLSEDSGLTKQGEILGTPHYLAPELVRGKPATTASDIYGLGAVMYRFFTGVAPYQGSTTEVLRSLISHSPHPLSKLRPDLPEWLVDLIGRMLVKEPHHRPWDARKLAEEMTRRASVHDMLVSRGAVGSWLIGLFSAEYAQELAEFHRFQRLDPRTVKRSSEQKTQILALAPSRSPSAHPIHQLMAPTPGMGRSWLVADHLSTTAVEPIDYQAPDVTYGAGKADGYVTSSSARPEAPAFGHSIFFMVGLLSLAIALGLGIGKVIGGLRVPPHLSVERRGEQEAECRKIYQEHMESLYQLGDTVPVEVWQLMAETGGTMLAGDVQQALGYLKEISRFLDEAEPFPR